MPRTPALVLCTPRVATTPEAVGPVELMAARLRARVPRLIVEQAVVGSDGAHLRDVVRQLSAQERPCVVVPLLLSLSEDESAAIGTALAGCPQAVTTGSLAAEPALPSALVSRLVAAGAGPGTAVVVAAPAPQTARAEQDLQIAADGVARRWAGRVGLAVGGTGRPDLMRAVQAARAAGAGRVAIAPYLVAAGPIYQECLAAGADVVGRPLTSDTALASLVLDRYEQGRARLAARGQAA